MRIAMTVLLGGLVSAFAPANAQHASRLLVGTGFVSPATDPGMHMLAAVDLSLGALRSRADFIVEQTRVRSVLAFANVIYSPLRQPIEVYGIAGAGSYLDNGPRLAGAAGIGIASHTVWRAPLALEARVFTAPERHVVLTLGVRP